MDGTPSPRAIGGPLEDKLDLAGRAEALAKFLTTCGTRMTVCISGDWGSGKTSFLNMVASCLGKMSTPGGYPEKTVIIGPFEAWRYEQEKSVLDPTCRETISGAKTDAQKAGEWFGRIAAFTTIVLTGLVKDLLENLVHLKIDGLDPKKLAALWKKLRSKSLVSSDHIQELKDAMAKLSEDRRIVIMVDDLDRCFPDNAVQIIESFKLLLDMKNFIYVLALQTQNLEQAIASRFARLRFPGGAGKHGQLARHYLDKIIDLEYRIPELNLERACNFLYLLQQTWLTPVDKLLLLAMVDHNPRALVRSVNALALVRELVGADDYTAHPGAFAKCMLLDHHYAELFVYLTTLSDPNRKLLEEGRPYRQIDAAAESGVVCDRCRQFCADAENLDQRLHSFHGGPLGEQALQILHRASQSPATRKAVLLLLEGPRVGDVLAQYLAAGGRSGGA